MHLTGVLAALSPESSLGFPPEDGRPPFTLSWTRALASVLPPCFNGLHEGCTQVSPDASSPSGATARHDARAVQVRERHWHDLAGLPPLVVGGMHHSTIFSRHTTAGYGNMRTQDPRADTLEPERKTHVRRPPIAHPGTLRRGPPHPRRHSPGDRTTPAEKIETLLPLPPQPRPENRCAPAPLRPNHPRPPLPPPRTRSWP